MKFKRILKLAALFYICALCVNTGAKAIETSKEMYISYFSEERDFFNMAEYTDDIPNEYPFIFGTNDSLPINNLSDKKLEELVPGHIYLKNWRTGEVSQYIKVEATAFTLTENNELFIAESSGIIYAYSRDGVRGEYSAPD